MNILLLCNKSPYPPREGGPIAMNAIVTGLLRAGHSVKILAINTNKYFVERDKIPQDYLAKTKFETAYTDLSIKPLDAFLNLFTTKSYHVERFINKELDLKLTRILEEEQFDVVQLESLFVAPYINTIRKHSSARIVLRAHNIEYLIWERIAGNCKNPVKKLYLRHLYRTLRKFEMETLENVDGVAAITHQDAAFFAATDTKTPVIGIPFGVLPEEYSLLDVECESPSLFHLGSMNWVPNQEGISWFLEKVWPEIYRIYPDLKFYLAGRMMPDWLIKAGHPNVEVVGEVESAAEFMQSKMAMIVPLFSGSGIRIKIIEGMALERTVISTTIGAEGIAYEKGRDILIADTEEEYIKAVCKCVDDPSYCETIGKNARKLIAESHNNDSIIKNLTGFYEKIT